MSNGLTNIDIRSLVTDAMGHVFAGTSAGLFRSTDRGDNWTTVNKDVTETNIACLAVDESGHIFAGTSAFLYRSMDHGDSWVPIARGDLRALAVSRGGDIFAGVPTGVYRSTDGGGNWTQTLPTEYRVTSLVINMRGHVFAGINGDGVFRSADNGGRWTQINDGLENWDIQALTVNGEGDLFAGIEWGLPTGIFRSTDNGDNWVGVHKTSNVWCFIVGHNGHVFAGTSGDVFRSTDNGESWAETNDGLPPNIATWSFAVGSDGTLFAGTSRGVFRSVDSTVTVIAETDEKVPVSFALRQNYPNPFNSRTIILYELPRLTRIALRIYNTLGQEVRTLLDEEQAGGKKSVVWDGKNDAGQNVSSGVYVYRLHTPGFVETKRLVLIK